LRAAADTPMRVAARVEAAVKVLAKLLAVKKMEGTSNKRFS